MLEQTVRRIMPHLSKGRLALAACTVVWAGVVLFLSTWEQPRLPSIGPSSFWAVGGHVVMYLILAALLLWLLSGFQTNDRQVRTVTITAVLSVTAYGGLIETLQRWVPARLPSRQDAIFNGTGAVLGASAAHLCGYLLRRRGSFRSFDRQATEGY